MKKTLFFYLILCLIASCRSTSTTTSLDYNTSEERIQEVPSDHSIEEISDAQSVFITPDLLFSITESGLFAPQEVPVPEVVDDFLPIDPFMRHIELKRRYFHSNTLDISPFEDNTITSIFLTESSLYAGTLRGGVFRFSREEKGKGQILVSPTESLFNRSVNSIKGDDSEILIASYASLSTYNSVTGKLEIISTGGSNRSVLTLNSRGDSYYYGTSGGSLYQFKGEGHREILNISSSIRSVGIINDQLLVFSGNGEVYVLDFHSDQITPVELNDNLQKELRVNDLEIWNNSLYISTTDGLIIYNLDSRELSRLYTGLVVLCSASTEKYIYWGTHSTGLIIYDKMNDSYSIWGLDMGLPALNITALEAEGEEIFLGLPDKGLLIINEEIHEKI